jgi:hypothetical protein
MNELGKKVKQLSQTSLCLVEIFIGKGISNERERFYYLLPNVYLGAAASIYYFYVN